MLSAVFLLFFVRFVFSRVGKRGKKCAFAEGVLGEHSCPRVLECLDLGLFCSVLGSGWGCPRVSCSTVCFVSLSLSHIVELFTTRGFSSPSQILFALAAAMHGFTPSQVIHALVDEPHSCFFEFIRNNARVWGGEASFMFRGHTYQDHDKASERKTYNLAACRKIEAGLEPVRIGTFLVNQIPVRVYVEEESINMWLGVLLSRFFLIFELCYVRIGPNPVPASRKKPKKMNKWNLVLLTQPPEPRTFLKAFLQE